MSVGHNSLTRFRHITELILSSPALRSTLEQVVTAISADIVKCNSVGIYLPQADGNFRGFVGKPSYRLIFELAIATALIYARRFTAISPMYTSPCAVLSLTM